MLKIERAIFDHLNFDFDAALKKFAAEKAQHHLTVDVPAPAAHPFVEAALAAGGYEIIEPLPEPEQQPTAPALAPVDPRKAEALQRLQKLQGKTAAAQLDEMRSLLALLLEKMPS